MLVSQRHKTAFVHIPKCGGSTVRHQFSNISDIGTDFSGFFKHPALGPVRLGHLPLWAVSEYYPEAFEILTRCQSHALSRNVFDRFESAVSQHLFQHQKKRINDFDLDEVLKVSQDIIENIRSNDRLVSAQYCHFIRQADFIFLEGERIIDKVYPLSAINQLVKDLSAATGSTASTALQSNQTLHFKVKGSEKVFRQLSGMTKRILPLKIHSHAKKIAKNLFTEKGSTHKGFAQRNNAISDFIRTYYAQDIILFDAASKQFDQREKTHT